MFAKVLIANRGEIAIRIARALAEMGIGSVAVHSTDDAASLHVLAADQAVALPGRGAAAYLDRTTLVAAAREAGCDAVHPGYGFLSESAEFAEDCAAAGLVFIGPAPATLRQLGDKAAARRLAQDLRIPLARGTVEPVDPAGAAAFMASLDGRPVMLKAVAGGGGRGMREVADPADLVAAYASASAEASAAFGSGALYIEELIRPARHVEVQILGDGSGAVTHLYERECSLQRRNQKVVEFAPAPDLAPDLRDRILAAAVTLAQAARVRTLCTMEFLIDGADPAGRFVFMEANPRVQVEHTVTEEITGIDLVQSQIALAAGHSLADLGLQQARIPAPRGQAVQLRINMERFDARGAVQPASGVLSVFAPPGGAGVRVESFGYPGYATSTNYDSLLAKLVVHHPEPGLMPVLGRAYRALTEFGIAGVETNIPLLQGLLHHPAVLAGDFDTGTLARIAPEILQAGDDHPRRFPQDAGSAVTETAPEADLPAGLVAQTAPIGGTLVSYHVAPGDEVRLGQPIAVTEAMKMEHVVTADVSGVVAALVVDAGAPLSAGQVILHLAPADLGRVEATQDQAGGGQDAALAALAGWRHDLSDAGRPEAVARQRGREMMTARERIAALADPDSFVEIGGHVRNLHADRPAPADGVVTGSCRIDGRPAYVLAQDFTVIGGSAGHVGDAKMIRLARLAADHGVPLVMILDGGGHRIQDGQSSYAYAAATPLFQEFARLSGWVPVVAAVLGFGFAANTNFAGMADYVAMLRGKATMGLAGPALVKAGTGEIIDTHDLGGAEVQVDQHGLADAAFDTEAEVLGAVRSFLSYLPSNARAAAVGGAGWQAADQLRLQDIVPANTRRAYDMGQVVRTLCDTGSVFDHKPDFAPNIVTAFGRIEGRAIGFIGNQPLAKGGMLDAGACEKAARFIAICDAFGLPLVYLVDIPGMSIGSGAERSVLGRRSARMLFELGHATVPVVSVVLRKGYGLGYLAMAGGRSFGADGAFAWPTAEICAMSVEGSVDVAWRRAIDAAEDPEAKRRELIAAIRANVGPLQAAEGFGIDDLILPDETRARIHDVLARARPRKDRQMPPKYRAISPI